jgi:hypothetical protein
MLNLGHARRCRSVRGRSLGWPVAIRRSEVQKRLRLMDWLGVPAEVDCRLHRYYQMCSLGVSRLFVSRIEMMDTFDDLAYFWGRTLGILAAVAEAYLPSRRAARADRLSALRCDRRNLCHVAATTDRFPKRRSGKLGIIR